MSSTASPLLTLLLLYVVFGLLLVALAVPLMLGKIPPNPWFGFRVPSTLGDETLWYKANRYVARWLLATGIVTVVAAVALYFVPGLTVDRYAWLLLGAVAVVLVPGIILSWRYLQRLKKSGL